MLCYDIALLLSMNSERLFLSGKELVLFSSLKIQSSPPTEKIPQGCLVFCFLADFVTTRVRR